MIRYMVDRHYMDVPHRKRVRWYIKDMQLDRYVLIAETHIRVTDSKRYVDIVYLATTRQPVIRVLFNAIQDEYRTTIAGYGVTKKIWRRNKLMKRYDFVDMHDGTLISETLTEYKK